MTAGISPTFSQILGSAHLLPHCVIAGMVKKKNTQQPMKQAHVSELHNRLVNICDLDSLDIFIFVFLMIQQFYLLPNISENIQDLKVLTDI